MCQLGIFSILRIWAFLYALISVHICQYIIQPSGIYVTTSWQWYEGIVHFVFHSGNRVAMDDGSTEFSSFKWGDRRNVCQILLQKKPSIISHPLLVRCTLEAHTSTHPAVSCRATSHTRDWEPVTSTLQALSLVEKAEPVQVRIASLHTTLEGPCGVCECKMDVKSTWISMWHRMDHVSCSLALFSKTPSWR